MKGCENTTLKNKIEKEAALLAEKIALLEKKAAGFPKEEFICTKDRNNFKWYRRKKDNWIYIPKKQREVAEKLATRKILLYHIEDLKNEKKALEAYLQTHNSYQSKAEKYISDHAVISELISTYYKPNSETFANWASEPFSRNLKHPEKLIHKTKAGFMVRSKSEASIVNALCEYHIPFRYECLLELNGACFYPDFTICHPETGQIIYWEHFGMMDDLNYLRSCCSKIETFASNEIIVGENLILTFESGNNPFDDEQAEEVVRKYFV